MRLYLMRHGAAVDLGDKGIFRDEDRPLTADGRRRTREAAAGLAGIGCRPARIVSSPLLRARETAELAAAELGIKGGIELLDALEPDARPEAAGRWLARQPPADLLLVGHLPQLPEFAAWLIGGAARARLDFRKAGAACVEFEERAAPGHGLLAWLLTPAILRRLAKAPR